MEGECIRSVSSATVLGVVIVERLFFVQFAITIAEKASKSFVTYAAGCWHERASLHIVRSALPRTQRLSLILLTKAYRMVSSVVLPVLAGVIPADLEVICADQTQRQHKNMTEAEVRLYWWKARDGLIEERQRRWDTEMNGRELHRYFSVLSGRLQAEWIDRNYQTS
ncbi:hypothetical protein EVAR_31191_1 [Eumeta japonica]|uniref:Uncharacterized protein n=1 Tax=Eumeta variegata TaxID=151549 RepID=A0A4C1VZP0_EUMVA|nr:hypothetical protein EVAR_31191_1 [Eumeta japonica]